MSIFKHSRSLAETTTKNTKIQSIIIRVRNRASGERVKYSFSKNKLLKQSILQFTDKSDHSLMELDYSRDRIIDSNHVMIIQHYLECTSKKVVLKKIVDQYQELNCKQEQDTFIRGCLRLSLSLGLLGFIDAIIEACFKFIREGVNDSNIGLNLLEGITMELQFSNDFKHDSSIERSLLELYTCLMNFNLPSLIRHKRLFRIKQLLNCLRGIEKVLTFDNGNHVKLINSLRDHYVVCLRPILKETRKIFKPSPNSKYDGVARIMALVQTFSQEKVHDPMPNHPILKRSDSTVHNAKRLRRFAKSERITSNEVDTNANNHD